MQKKPPRWLTALILMGIIGTVVSIAFQNINAPFLMDDIDQLNQTASQHSLRDALKTDCYEFFRPVKTCVFFLFSSLYPDEPTRWRIVGLAIYSISILLFYALSKRLFPNAWALIATAIWALAPTQVSSYAWCSCINILIMTVSTLGAILLFDRLQSKPHGESGMVSLIIGIALLYALAFFSYEAAITLPVLLQVWSLCRKQDIWTRKNIIAMLACGATGVTLLLVRHSMKGNFSIENGSIHGFTPSQLSWASGLIIWDHFSLWFWPFDRQAITATLVNNSNPFAEFRFIFPWIFIVSIALVAIRIRKHYPVITWGLAFFAVSFFPMSNLIPLFNGPLADYYLTVPSIGLAIAFTKILQRLWTSSPDNLALRILILLLCILVPTSRLLAVGSSFRWSHAWENESDLFANTLKTFPEAYTAKASLARCRMLNEDYAEAEALACESAIAAPWFHQSSYVLINIYLKTNRFADALSETEKILTSNPQQVFPWNAMGFLAEHHLNDQTRAIEAYTVATRLKWQTESEEAYINLTRLLSLEGRGAEALSTLKEAHTRAPGAKIIAGILPLFKADPNLFRNATE